MVTLIVTGDPGGLRIGEVKIFENSEVSKSSEIAFLGSAIATTVGRSYATRPSDPRFSGGKIIVFEDHSPAGQGLATIYILPFLL